MFKPILAVAFSCFSMEEYLPMREKQLGKPGTGERPGCFFCFFLFPYRSFLTPWPFRRKDPNKKNEEETDGAYCMEEKRRWEEFFDAVEHLYRSCGGGGGTGADGDLGSAVAHDDAGGLAHYPLEITSQAGEAVLGRPQGRYYTAEIPDTLGQGDDDYEQSAQTLAELLGELLPAGDGCLLVAGLGNEGVTPDALGPETASRVLVTRHLTTADSKLAELFRAVAVVCPGVLGQTGLESAELLRGAAATVRPVAILAIDALAARSLTRLGNTIQITDTGLLPGGGIGNSRQELSFRTMACRWWALGCQPSSVRGRWCRTCWRI